MNQILPVMLLKGFILLPNQEARLELNNKISFNVINLSIKYFNSYVLIVCPKDQYEEDPDVTDLPIVGVIGKIKSKIELSNGSVRVVLTGIKRVKINNYLNDAKDSDILEADVTELIFPKFDEIEETAIRRKLLELLDIYIKESPDISNSIVSTIKNIPDLNRLTDVIVAFIPFNVEKKLSYMEEVNPLYRARKLIKDINIELSVIELDSKIDESLREEFENTQRDYILRERIAQMKKELGEEDDKDNLISSYLDKLSSLKLNDKTTKKLNNEIKKLDYTNESNPENSIIRGYLDLVLNLPWNNLSKDETNLEIISGILDKSHYGLEKIKNRILEYIAVKIRNPQIKSPIICLVGPPGVGKTSLSMGIAKALKKEFYKISVGGLNDAAELNGHRRTYMGAAPGKIIQALSKCETRNPILLIDEVDKMTKDFRGDPASALLEILDLEQNSLFTDNYVEEPFDLSQVLFILTANDQNAIPEVLRDRLEIIELSSYTEFDKINIAKKHLLPNIYEDHLIKTKDLKISDDVIKEIILNYTKEAGVRELRRKLETIIRKVITESMLNNTKMKKSVSLKDLNKYLGIRKYNNLKIVTHQVGLVNGLAYTPYGGCVLPIETTLYPGSQKIEITGMLGDSMKESIKVAKSYIKSNLDLFKIKIKDYDKTDFHIHFLEGAIPKDGPSAGSAIVTAMLSLLLKKEVPSDIAMTGEISLRGDILEIGGLKEKIIGGYNDNIRIFFIPKANEKNLEDLPKEILNSIEIKLVENYKEIFSYIFSN